MVLSNKKLKQKLRAAKAESLAEDISGNDKKGTSSELQELLEAAKQRSRLSKREKRRKSQSLGGFDGEKGNPDGKNDGDSSKGEENDKSGEKKEGASVGNGDNGENGDVKKKKKMKKKQKKRKREEGDTGERELEEENGVVKEVNKAKKKRTNKNQKKKKNKKKTKAKSGEEAEAGGRATEATKGLGDSQISGDTAAKVYVGGIPYYSTEDDIRSYFEGCGTITEVDCMTFPDSGKFRGIAILTFKTDAAAKRALALDGSDMGGFFLKIQPYKTTQANKVSDFAPKIVEGYNRIYVGNLSWDITEDDLKKFFADCNISSIRFGMDKETGEFRGYAHVDFADNMSLMMALKLDQRIVCGRPIKISCAVPMKGAKVVTGAKVVSTIVKPASKEDDSGGVSSTISGKIRRRTCYECGQKGHLLADCPKKQSADQTNPSTG